MCLAAPRLEGYVGAVKDKVPEFRCSERSPLTFFRVSALCAATAALGFAQAGQAVPGPAQTPAPAVQAAPTPQQPASPASPAATATPAQNVPDYPEPRTLTLGAFYWFTGPGTDTGIFGGHQATDYSTLADIGRPHRTPGFELFFPITRTGELHVEVFRASGRNNQTTPVQTDIFLVEIPATSYLSSSYRISTGKVYLDDLLWPHKFPVSRFRLKSLWEFDYVAVRGVVDAPYQDAIGFQTTGTGTRNIYYPAFGIAAEYALTKHILFRASASGFGFPKKADLWDAEATLGYRHGSIEVRGGAKAFHYKTSPTNDEYMKGTLAGAFVDVRYHWSL